MTPRFTTSSSVIISIAEYLKKKSPIFSQLFLGMKCCAPGFLVEPDILDLCVWLSQNQDILHSLFSSAPPKVI